MIASALLPHSPVAGVLVSPSGLLLLTNAAWDALAGRGGEEWLQSFHPDDRVVVESLCRRGGGGARHEIRIAGSEGWKWVVASSFVCEEGHTIWFMEIDSGREDVLVSLQRERELNDLKNRFISVVSHEFRTPLTVILSSAELLQHYGAKWADDRRAMHFHKIHTAVSVMTTLLDNVGLYGRAESGALDANPQPFAPGELLEEIVSDARAAAPAGAEIRIVDEAPGRVLVSDAKLLRHAVANLLSNAVRFSTGGGSIEIGSRWNGDVWVLEVFDRGIGLLPEDRERVWERFQRGGNTDGISGTGLGLPIVRRCAELLGAKATLLDRPGGGCVARLEVPGKPAAGVVR